jgi:XTP/dITP diphosphohydrolase
MKLTLVTGSQKKALAVQKILGFPIDIEEIDLEEIQSNDIKEITLRKTQEAFEKIKTPVIVDDVGLYVEALSDFPGPLVKWVLKSGGGNASLLLKMLKGEVNRRAIARSAIGYHDGIEAHIFIGESEGTISEEIRGNNNFSFGWDPVFIPVGSKKTYAEMSFEEKSEISHRTKALAEFKKFLDSKAK